MAKYLVIVESPAKVKTIKKFLGSNYEVVASQGHVRDLPKSNLGIDVENDYEPNYITIRGKGDILAQLRREVKKADKVYLATDPDREGEAISWHLAQALKIADKDVNRISFNEITKNAVKASIKEPRKIDMNLVDAQQSRRILDRMVGYEISPVLWAKVKGKLSAGRVQSVALRIICDREEEINDFIAKEYWTIEGTFKLENEKKPFTARYVGRGNQTDEIPNEDALKTILAEVKGKACKVSDVKETTRTRKAPLPFTTSTLQQEASKTLNFSTQKTMSVAQQLYEGVDVEGRGTIGLITYLRTDSTRIATEADESAREYIRKTYGEAYYAPADAEKAGKKIQDAHEAIRPTDIELIPALVKDSLTKDQFRLYQLIWKRFVASRMQNAKYETKTVKLSVGEHTFATSVSKLAFDGFMSIYVPADDEKEESGSFIGSIDKNSKIKLEDVEGKQHFTQPPPHYTEASLVKALEELGIGRPSTYAPTITTIIKRNYVSKESKNLYVTELGDAVNKIMVDAFPAIVDTNFTANLESLLDGVGDGSIPWKSVISNFFPDLMDAVKVAQEELKKVEVKEEVSDVACDKCGRMMVIKYGPHGKFLACPGFPECQNVKSYLEKAGVDCPKCGKDVIIRRTRKGRKYFSCEGYPDCDFMSWQKPVKEKCPRCGSFMVEKGKKIACSDEKCGYVSENETK